MLGDGLFRPSLVQLVKPAYPIPLNFYSKFDKKLFHDNFTSAGGFRLIGEETEILLKFFDLALGLNEDQQAQSILADSNEIDAATDEAIGPIKRLDSRLPRIGQGKFRRNAISTQGEEKKCAVTGVALPAH